MYKLLSENMLTLYSDVYTNNIWLTKYENGESWTQRSHIIINKYLSKYRGHCVLYGSKSVELMLQARRNNTLFKLKINDYDVYSSRPKQVINDLYEIFKQESYAWNVHCAFARNHGTCTLYVNDNRLIDITYMNQKTLDILPTFDSINGIRCISYLMSMSACTSVLADIESVYMIPKTIEKLRLLCNEYTFKFNSNDINTINIFDDKKYCKIIHEIAKSLDSTVNNNSLNYIQALNGNEILEFKDGKNIKNITINALIDTRPDEKNIEIINENTKLKSYRCYIEPSKHRYFFTGSIACYIFMNVFGNNININNEYINSDKMVKYLFDNDIELYVENINLILNKLIETFSSVKCEVKPPIEFPCMFSASVRVLVDNKYVIYLYELTHERFIETVNVQLPYNLYISNFKCTCYIFLISHLLLKMAIYDKTRYSKYSNIISLMTLIANKNRTNSIFKPHTSNKFTAGNRKSLIKSNDIYIENNKEINKKEEDSSEEYYINVNYSTIV